MMETHIKYTLWMRQKLYVIIAPFSMLRLIFPTIIKEYLYKKHFSTLWRRKNFFMYF